MELIEKVARAIDEIEMFYRFNDWTCDHVPGLPIEICTGHDECIVVARYPGSQEKDGAPHLARHLAEARAKAAIRAMLDGVEPCAWRYHFPGDLEHGWQRHEFERRIQSYEGMSCNEEDAGCVETPLYSLDALKEAL